MIGSGSEDDGFRTSHLITFVGHNTGWTFTGTHTGVGIYGAPSGARVRIMGLSQHHILHENFVQEYTLFDELGLIKQITAKRLAEP